MHGSLADNAAWFAHYLEDGPSAAAPVAVEAALCVPAVYLEQCRRALAGGTLAWGAQDVSAHPAGPRTGEIAASMLAELGCRFVIVGHSERRMAHGENDAEVARKVVAALGAGLSPIICLGETLAERVAETTAAVIERQLSAVLEAVDEAELTRIVLAYEPVWSIGTGRAATPQMAQQAHADLRAALARRAPRAAGAVRILYGGSMNAANAGALLAMPDVDGGLIGSAALKVQDFLAIVCAAA